ncbi:MAG: CPBP family intramembrane glutamic endopeptidase [Polyangiales bacterium]
MRRRERDDDRLPGETAFVAGFIGLLVATLGSMGCSWILIMVLAARRGIAIGGSATGASEALGRLQIELPVITTSLLVTALGLVVPGLLAARVARVPAREALGFRPAKPALFVAAVVGIAALGPASDLLVRLYDARFPGHSMDNLALLVGIARREPWWIAVPLLALVPGFGEEVFFRGLVLRSIRRPWLAIPISALGFAAIHLDPPHVVGVIPLGFYLAYVAYRADSTWVTIVAHAANNTIAVIAAKTGLPGSAADEPPPPLGWVIGGVFVALLVCVYVERATRRGSLASTSERASATSA